MIGCFVTRDRLVIYSWCIIHEWVVGDTRDEYVIYLQLTHQSDNRDARHKLIICQ